MFTITWFFIQFEERETVHVLNVIQSWRRRRRLAKTHARWPYNMIFYSIWRERQFMCWMSLVYIDIILIYYQIVESENVFQSISRNIGAQNHQRGIHNVPGCPETYLSDPSPIIGYACHSLTQWLNATQNSLKFLLLLMLMMRNLLTTVRRRFGSWTLVIKLSFCSDFEDKVVAMKFNVVRNS